MTKYRIVFWAAALSLLASSGCQAQSASTAASNVESGTANVTLMQTPAGGIQTQAALDSKGALHLIYFKGEPRAGDLFYVKQKAGEDTFSEPLRVNSGSNSAIAMGTIRGPQLAIGKGDSVHVAWNGSDRAEPKGAGGNPMLYTRLNASGTAFEPQRNLITSAGGIDGGGALAANQTGDVYVIWHAAPAGSEDAQRAVYMARSSDNGRTFEREKKINIQPTGACACCQIQALIDSKGALYVLYRAAGQNVQRDSMLLVSRDKGATFQSADVHPWNINYCPMSSYALAQNPNGVLAAWETQEQIYFSQIVPATTKFSVPVVAPGTGKTRKHPVVAFNAKGEMLLAWTEGTGWNKGGSLAWQIYDKNGRATTEKGRANGVPVWSKLAVFARPDNRFTLIY